MNDRFNFRVWNKLTHSFTTGGAIKFGGLCFVDEEDLGIKLGEHQELYIIEQCTGLKDKNGNLIYEGDVVKQTQYDFDPAKRRVVTGIIKWHPGHAQFVFEYPDGTGGHNISEIGWGIIEIIGNIHEQPEQKDK